MGSRWQRTRRAPVPLPARPDVGEALISFGARVLWQAERRRALVIDVAERHTEIRLLAASQHPCVDLRHLPGPGLPREEAEGAVARAPAHAADRRRIRREADQHVADPLDDVLSAPEGHLV